MKVNLISFQDKAVKELRVDIADALDTYRRRQKTQVVSLQAPTGAGKTIIAAALIESIYYGMTLPDGSTFDEQPEANGRTVIEYNVCLNAVLYAAQRRNNLPRDVVQFPSPVQRA